MITREDYVDNLLIAKKITAVHGNIIECGTWKGGMIAGIATLLENKRNYHLFDSFEGLPPAKEVDGEKAIAWQRDTESAIYFDNCTADISFAKKAMEVAGITNYQLHKGWFSETTPKYQGAWLSVFRQLGVENTLGVDGNWVDKDKLYIDKKFFLEKNLTEPLSLNRKFDLAMSLEVAEHLPESAADTFVETLTKLSDNIVFSAAIPNQGGQNHINEQWHTYWIEKFEARGFYCNDIIRPVIWNNPNVEYWYAQNMLYFTADKNFTSNTSLINIIHPTLFEHRNRQINQFETGLIGVKPAFIIFMKALKIWLKKKFNHADN